MSRPIPFAAVILAAGQGTRMKSALPKVLHPLAQTPMISHVLASVRALNPVRVIVVVAPGMSKVTEAVAPAEIVTQRKQRGTGDALAAAREALTGFEGDVLVLYGDAPLVTSTTLSQLFEVRHGAPEAALSVAGMRPPEPGSYGRLVLDADGDLEAIIEARDCTPAQRKIGYCNAGPMAIDGRLLFSLLDKIGTDNSQGEYYLTDIVREARKRGLLCRAVERPYEEMLGVNDRVELAFAEAELQKRLRNRVMAAGVTLVAPETVFLAADTEFGKDCVVGPYTVFGPGVTIGDEVEIVGFSHIVGAKVGDRARVGPYARLRPGADLAQEVHVGNFVEVKNSRLEMGVKANHLAYLGDSYIGMGTNIGAGTITCNYDGFEKHRTQIGADVFIGSNSSLVAPVKIGDGAMVGAGSIITEDVPKDALAVARVKQMNKAGGSALWRELRAVEAKAPKRRKP